MMIDLILNLFVGHEAVPVREIKERCDHEHRRRGGAQTPVSSLTGSFKKACADLKSVGAIESAGHGYWHVHGWSSSENIHDVIRKKRVKRASGPGTDRHYLKYAKYGIQKGRCASCGHHFRTVEDLTVDHIFPRYDGGSDEPENIQLLCLSCNSAKGNRAPDYVRSSSSESIASA